MAGFFLRCIERGEMHYPLEWSLLPIILQGSFIPIKKSVFPISELRSLPFDQCKILFQKSSTKCIQKPEKVVEVR